MNFDYFSAQVGEAFKHFDSAGILFFFWACILYGLQARPRKLACLIFSGYLGALISLAIPFEKISGQMSLTAEAFFKVGTFLALTFLISSGLSGVFFKKLSFKGKRLKYVWPVLIFSFLTTGFFTTVSLQLLPPALLTKLSLPVSMLFTSTSGRLAWVVLPVIALFFLKKR